MKFILILVIFHYVVSDKLDRTYLPPRGSKVSGGSPGNIQAPFEYPEAPSGTIESVSPSTLRSKTGLSKGDTKVSIGINREVPDVYSRYSGQTNVPETFFQKTSPITLTFLGVSQTTTHSPFQFYNIKNRSFQFGQYNDLNKNQQNNNQESFIQENNSHEQSLFAQPSKSISLNHGKGLSNESKNMNFPYNEELSRNSFNYSQESYQQSISPQTQLQNERFNNQPSAAKGQYSSALKQSSLPESMIHVNNPDEESRPYDFNRSQDKSQEYFASQSQNQGFNYQQSPADGQYTSALKKIGAPETAFQQNYHGLSKASESYENNQKQPQAIDGDNTESNFGKNHRHQSTTSLGSNTFTNSPESAQADLNYDDDKLEELTPIGGTFRSFTPNNTIPQQKKAASPNIKLDEAQAQTEKEAILLNYENIRTPDEFSFSFDTSNGIHVDESGTATDGVKAHGSYSYTGNDGKIYSVIYSADENGFIPQGDHLPTPPPVPEAIQRVLDKSNKDKEAGIYDDGSYDDKKYGYRKYLGKMDLQNIQVQISNSNEKHFDEYENDKTGSLQRAKSNEMNESQNYRNDLALNKNKGNRDNGYENRPLLFEDLSASKSYDIKKKNKINFSAKQAALKDSKRPKEDSLNEFLENKNKTLNNAAFNQPIEDSKTRNKTYHKSEKKYLMSKLSNEKLEPPKLQEDRKALLTSNGLMTLAKEYNTESLSEKHHSYPGVSVGEIFDQKYEPQNLTLIEQYRNSSERVFENKQFDNQNQYANTKKVFSSISQFPSAEQNSKFGKAIEMSYMQSTKQPGYVSYGNDYFTHRKSITSTISSQSVTKSHSDYIEANKVFQDVDAFGRNVLETSNIQDIPSRTQQMLFGNNNKAHQHNMLETSSSPAITSSLKYEELNSYRQQLDTFGRIVPNTELIQGSPGRKVIEKLFTDQTSSRSKTLFASKSQSTTPYTGYTALKTSTNPKSKEDFSGPTQTQSFEPQRGYYY